MALKAEVSPSTVSNYLNKTAPVNIKTGQKIERVINKIGYSPHIIAQGLRTGRTNVIAIVLPEISDPFYSKLLEGMEEVASRKGYSTIIACNQYDNIKEKQQIKNLLNTYIAGYVFATGAGDYKELREIKKYGIPFVVVDRKIVDESIYSVEEDNYKSFYNATKYIISKGHKSIYFVSEPLIMKTLRDRFKGYKNALLDSGIPFDKSKVMLDKKLQMSKTRGGYEVMQKILKKEKPDTIFATADSIAFGAMHAAMEKGYKIPDDVSFMGNGNTSFSQFSNPPLTTIRQNKKKMGILSMEMLINLLEGKRVTPKKIVLETEVVERATIKNI